MVQQCGITTVKLNMARKIYFTSLRETVSITKRLKSKYFYQKRFEFILQWFQYKISPHGMECSTSGRKSFRHAQLERFLSTLCASQTIAICFVEYRFKTQRFWHFSMQGRKNGTDLKFLPF